MQFEMKTNYFSFKEFAGEIDTKGITLIIFMNPEANENTATEIFQV